MTKIEQNFDDLEGKFLKGIEPVSKDKDGNITGFVIDQSKIEMPLEVKKEEDWKFPELIYLTSSIESKTIFELHYTNTNVKRAKYLQDTKTLEIEFKGEALYHYFDVPIDIWDLLIHSEDISKFLAKEIKGKFEYKKV